MWFMKAWNVAGGMMSPMHDQESKELNNVWKAVFTRGPSMRTLYSQRGVELGVDFALPVGRGG